jgi:very-short-patch-repair endonuclease
MGARCLRQGYFIMRFLVEDIGKRLDQVLDCILRTLIRLGG